MRCSIRHSVLTACAVMRNLRLLYLGYVLPNGSACQRGVKALPLQSARDIFSRKAELCVRSRSRLPIVAHLSRPYKALSMPCFTGSSSFHKGAFSKASTKDRATWRCIQTFLSLVTAWERLVYIQAFKKDRKSRSSGTLVNRKQVCIMGIFI